MSSDDEELDWDMFKKKTLEEILEELQPNCLHHLRLRDNEGLVEVVVVLASGGPARKLNKLVTKRFSPGTPVEEDDDSPPSTDPSKRN